MPGQGGEVVVGLDNGGTAINATVLDSAGRFLVDRLVETPSRVAEGPAGGIEALSDAVTGVLGVAGVSLGAVRAGGLGTPRPAHAARGGAPPGAVELPQHGPAGRTAPIGPGVASPCAAPWGPGWACRSSTTTTRTPRRCTPTTSTSGPTPATAPRCR